MTSTQILLLASPALALAGCTSTGSQLFFGEAVNYGVTINTGPSADGVDFNVGYKDRSIAIVPTSVVSGGQGYAIDAQSQDKEGETKDALSVFGQFKSAGAPPADTTAAPSTAGTPPSPPRRNITLGRFFATGIAATNLAEGYKQGWSGEKNKTPSIDAARAETPVSTTLSSSGDRPNPHQPPLVFVQSNSLGFDIQTAVSTEGPQFTLGYGGRNLALIPITMKSGNGTLLRLGSSFKKESATDFTSNDALSVFGQFEASTETVAFNYGLNRFFTTGVAARRLTEGLRAHIAAELAKEKPAP